MLKYIIVIGLFIVSVPFWLPTSLGGDTSYHFVLTDSMKGTLDPGAFVVLRSSDTYGVGDAVGYHFEAGNGKQITVLHRIISQMPDGKFILRGDAVETTEEVAPDAITGRMVFAVPALGFLPGAFRAAPLMLGGLLLTAFFVAGGLRQGKSKKEKQAGKASKKENLFIPAALVVLATIPFASLNLSDMVPFASASALGALLEKIPLFAFLLGIVAVTRMGEVVWVTNPNGKGSASKTMVEMNYIIAIVMAITVVPIAEVLDSARTVFTF